MRRITNPLPLRFHAEWHPTLNGDLFPSEVAASSNRKVWWVCNKLHEYEAVIANRTGRGNECPYCSGRRPILGETDLATLYPIAVELWSKENVKTPQEYVIGSGAKVIWVCSNKHTFTMPIRDFVKQDFSCSACHLAEHNLLIKYPEIAKTWDYEANGLEAKDIYPGTNGKYAWRCSLGHQWWSPIKSRLKLKECPVCSGLNFLSGFNDLATKYPDLAKKWHPTKNGDVLPSQVKSRSTKSYYWKQSCSHTVKASIAVMLKTSNRCPYCAGQKVLQGFNDLSTLNPRLASEWNTAKNGSIKPSDVPVGTGKIVWWKCLQGHEWEASVLNRTKGDNCPYCGNKKVLAGLNDLKTLRPDIAAQWSSKNTTNADEVSRQSPLLAIWECDKKHEWEARVYNRTGVNKTGCPSCWASTFVSKAEQQIYDFIISLGLQAEQSNRKLLGKELDIYIPEKKIAIEFNGLYWHSEATGKDKDYHRNKWLDCKDKGIQLIQVWEDEWNRNPEQIKRMLAHKLGISTERKVFARKTLVEVFNKKEVEKFLNENHVQGFASGSYYLGLREKGDHTLVAVLVLKKEAGTSGKTLNITRYATSANVVGGFTKLIKHAEKTYKPESFITFADHGVSDGGLYENNGFIADKELAPDYMYVVDGERKHKFGYRLKRFQNDSDLLWEEGLTEKELAKLNGLERIWDAGKTRYRKNI